MVVCVFSLCCKMVCPSMISSVRYAGVVLCVGVCVHVHATHTVDVAVSVGPVGGAAVARLVDLALLLQAVGLAPLVGNPLSILSKMVVQQL